MTEVNVSDTEVFPAEFRHEVVMKFCRDWMDGSMDIVVPPYTDKDMAKRIGEHHGTLVGYMRMYFSDTDRGYTKSELEDLMFSRITSLKLLGAIPNNSGKTVRESDIERLEKKMDNVTQLLTRLVTILDEIGKSGKGE